MHDHMNVKNLTNVNTDIFLKIKNCAEGHIICRLILYSDWYSSYTHVTYQLLWLDLDQIAGRLSLHQWPGSVTPVPIR